MPYTQYGIASRNQPHGFIGSPDSPANGSTLTLLHQRQKPSPDLCEQRRRNESITDYTRAARQWRKAAVWPFIDVMLGNNDPAWRIIQTDGLTNARRNLDTNGIARRWTMRDRHNDDEAWIDRRIRGRHETSWTFLALVAAGDGIPAPQIVVPKDEAEPRFRQRHQGPPMTSAHPDAHVRNPSPRHGRPRSPRATHPS